MHLDPQDVEKVIAIARRAGRLVLEMQQRGSLRVRGKSNEIDLVTEADLASERYIRGALQELALDVGFWGEESNEPPDEESFWLVDPIDGTVNFANNIPCFAVNIALNLHGALVLAVTVVLPLGTVYWATAGGGAFQRAPTGEEVRLRVNQVTRLRNAILSTGFPYSKAENSDNNGAEFAYFMPRCQGLRRMGSAAVDLALVAAGAFAVHWERNLSPWDIAAGALIVQEAGGRVTDYAGRSWSMSERNFIASNGQPDIHQAMVEGLHAVREASQ